MRGVFLVLLNWEITLFLKSKILIFWNFAFPLLLFIVLLNAFGGPTSLGSVDVVVADADRTSVSAGYIDVLRKVFTSNEAVSSAVKVDPNATAKAGSIVISIPSGFETSLKKHSVVDLAISFDSGQTLAQRTAVEIIRAVTTEFEVQLINGGHVVRIVDHEITHPRHELSYSEYLATGVLVMTLLSTCTIGLIIPLVARRESGVLRTLQCHPLRHELFMASFITSRLLVATAFSVMFFMGVSLACRLSTFPWVTVMPRLVALVLYSSVVFCLIGLVVASRLRSVVSANALANVVYFPLVFLGNLMIPVRGFAPSIQRFLSYSPGSALAVSLRDVVFDGATLTMEWQSLCILGCWGVAAAAIANYFFVWDPE